MNNEEKYNKTTRTIAWIAFALAALAMLFSIASFNKANNDYNQGRNGDTSRYQEESEREVVGAQARAELIALEAKLRTAQAGDNIANEVRAVRDKIRKMYENKNAELRNEARQMDMDLEQIERDVRIDTAQGLEKLQNLINKLEADIRTDEN